MTPSFSLPSCLVAAALAVATFSPLPLPAAELVESQVTFALKVYFNPGLDREGDKVNYVTATLKNADFMEMMNVPYDRKTTRLIRKDFFPEDEEEEERLEFWGATRYFLREKDGGEEDVTEFFNWTFPAMLDAVKRNVKADTGTGTENVLRADTLDFWAEGDLPLMRVSGVSRYTVKKVIPKGTELLVDLTTVNLKAGGWVSNLFVPNKKQPNPDELVGQPAYGPVEGTIKISGAKLMGVVVVPPVPEESN